MKIIDADKLMQRIKHKLCISSLDYLMESEKAIINVIESEPSIEMPTWIPCSERLPEYRKTVLISTFWGVKTGFLDSTEAYGDFWEIIEDDATVSLYSVYAWMPLLKPWEGADDETD